MNITLKDLPKIIQSLKRSGYAVLKKKAKLNNRPCYTIERNEVWRLLTDYELINYYLHESYIDIYEE